MINNLSLPRNIRRIPVFGLGCVGGAAGLSQAATHVRAFPDQIAALVSVETCCLTLQRDDFTTANLISSALFGDGAASVLVAGAECNLPGIEIVDTRSTLYPGTEDLMGWDISEKGFQIVLSPRVPDIIREQLGHDADELLAPMVLNDLTFRIGSCTPEGPRSCKPLKTRWESAMKLWLLPGVV